MMSELRINSPEEIGRLLAVPPPPGDMPPEPPPIPPNPYEDRGLVSIDVSVNHLPTLNALCWQAIKQGNQPPVLFLYGGQMVRVVRNPDGTVLLQHVTAEIMRHHLSMWAHWNKEGMALVKPPLDVIKDVLATKDMALPRLTRVVHVPVFGPGGSLQTEAGFDPESGVLYSPLSNFTALPVPAVLTRDDLDKANALICNDLLGDFPFASDADRDNAVSLALLPFVREMVDGPTPNHLIEASMPGSGKGLLASSLLYPSIGRDMGLTTQPRDDDEWRKKITSMLMEGKPCILIDNVSRMLDSGTLAAAITGDTWSERILGQNSTTQIKIRCCWVTTGNNITISTELARRSIRIRLTPKTDRPEDRENFIHGDLMEWIEANRARLVQASHIIVKWWIQEGRPKAKLRPLGSFERWSNILGGILGAAGYEQFLANARDFQSRSDTERQTRSLFCSTWYEWMERNKIERCSVGDLLGVAEGVDGLSLRGSTEKARQISLGMYLKASEEMVIDFTGEDENGKNINQKFTIERAGTEKGKQMWKVVLFE